MQAPRAARHGTLSQLQAWLVGAAIAGVATPFVLPFSPWGLVAYVGIVAALVLRGPRTAFGGTILLATGLWFTYWHLSMVERCEAMRGSCQVINANGTAVPAMTFVAVGAALSVYGLARSAAARRSGAA